MAEIKNAVLGLKQALEDIRSNTDASQVNIVKLNLKEARDMLARRLYEVCGICVRACMHQEWVLMLAAINSRSTAGKL